MGQYGSVKVSEEVSVGLSVCQRGVVRNAHAP